MFARTLLTASAALIAAAPAFAGGFAEPIVPAAPAAPVVVAPAAPVAASGDWTGFYVGGQLGFGRLTLEDQTTAGLPDDESDGAIYGLHAGYMRDFGRFVLGAEVDFDGTQIESQYYDSLSEDDAASIGSVVRGKVRLGYDAGRVMPYITAGVAQARLNSDNELVEADLEDSYDGRFIGIGAAFALNDRFVVGIEALRHNFEEAPFVEDDAMVDTISLRGSIRF